MSPTSIRWIVNRITTNFVFGPIYFGLDGLGKVG